MKQQLMRWQWHKLDHANHLHLAPDNHASTSSITQFFTGLMLFLTPNKQCQRIEDHLQQMTFKAK